MYSTDDTTGSAPIAAGAVESLDALVAASMLTDVLTSQSATWSLADVSVARQFL
jgi:hypothetical protein